MPIWGVQKGPKDCAFLEIWDLENPDRDELLHHLDQVSREVYPTPSGVSIQRSPSPHLGIPMSYACPLYPTIRGIIAYWGGAEGYPLGVITSPEGLQMGSI